MIQFTYKPNLTWLIAGSALAIFLFWWSYRRAKGRPTPGIKILLITLRCLAIAAVVFCLMDPQWVEMVNHEQKSRMAVLLDNSRSMSIVDLPGGRMTAAKEWIKKQMLPIAPSGVSIASYTLSQGLAPLHSVDSASPTGSVTALSEALENVLSLPGDDPLTGVILLSDGIGNSDKDPDHVAKLYRRKGIPIHTVTVGTTNDMQDVILENVQVKRAVPNEAPTRLALTLRSPGFKDRTVSVQIRSQKDIVAAREVKLNGGLQKIELDLTPRQKGFQVYEAVIPPITGEWLTSNNRRVFGLEVVDPTIRVIYMEGTPQQPTSPIPEWKYLKDALESDPNIKVKTLYRQFGSNGQYLNTIDADPESGEKIYPVEHPTRGFPRTLSELLEYDVVIHSDIKKESFTPAQLQNMAKLVEDYGGGFVMIGGNSAFGKGGYHHTILDRIIPVAMESSDDSQNTRFKIQVPRAAYMHPIMAIGGSREETEAIWTRKFPWLYGYNRVHRAKPGAVVLAQNPSYQSANGPGLLLAVQEIGKGRSMAFTSDTTRTWGRDFESIWGEPIRADAPLSEQNCDSRYYRQFWVNAVRWLASGKVGRTNNPVTLELAQSQCVPGENISAVVKVRDDQLQEISDAQVSLYFGKLSATNLPIRARFDATTRSYRADIRPSGTGTFTVTAVANRNGSKLGDDKQLLVSEATDVEMADVRARPDFMSALARETHGENFSLAQKNAAPPGYIFAKAPPPIIEYRRTAFWDKSIWMTLILALLATEWAVRRIRGLA
ncbi:MAG TPA: glutamine amidotransferase [Verrucomicrobiae bacterium]|nr:glutamine amidotransferase [Verrucomicrobiae bacterium]